MRAVLRGDLAAEAGDRPERGLAAIHRVEQRLQRHHVLHVGGFPPVTDSLRQKVEVQLVQQPHFGGAVVACEFVLQVVAHVVEDSGEQTADFGHAFGLLELPDDGVQAFVVDGHVHHLGIVLGEGVGDPMDLHIKVAPIQEVVGQLLGRAEYAVEQVLLAYQLLDLVLSDRLDWFAGAAAKLAVDGDLHDRAGYAVAEVAYRQVGALQHCELLGLRLAAFGELYANAFDDRLDVGSAVGDEQKQGVEQAEEVWRLEQLAQRLEEIAL